MQFIKADLGTASGAVEVVERIMREWRGLDILVNNLGTTDTGPGGPEVLQDEDWQNILNVNRLAPVRLDHAFLSGVIERKAGVIIHISSVAQCWPLSNSTLAYAAAKGALSTYSKGVAKKGSAPERPRCHDVARFHRDLVCPRDDHGYLARRKSERGGSAPAHRGYAGWHSSRASR